MSQNLEKQPIIPSTPVAFIIFVSKPFWRLAWSTILIVVFASALSQATAIVFKWIVEAIEAGDAKRALLIGMSYPVAVFVTQILYRITALLGLTWSIKIKKHIGEVLFGHAINHGHAYFSNRFAGSLLNKIMNVISGVDNLLMDFLYSYLATGVSLIVTLYFIFTVDVLSGFIFFIFIIVLLVTNKFFVQQKRKLSLKAAAASSKMRGTIVDVFGNISAVRQFTTKQSEEELLERQGEEWELHTTKSMRHSERTLTINALLLFIFSGAMFYVLLIRWSAGLVSTADFVFVLALYSYITGSLIFIGRVMTQYARVMGEIQEGLDEILIPFDIVDVLGAKQLHVKNGAIDWKGVDFEFGENKVFNDFNLTIAAGQRVGLVGHSGAGKSTFVSLLLRQHDVTSGSIEIDGQNIAQVTQNSLREQIAVVPQEPLLFHRTIRENIAYGKPDASDEEIVTVAKKAQAHEFISQLEKGYDTLVGERGVKLSGGQKQRVAIARAMLKDAPILVLDEATSALDSESEVAIQTALHALMEGKTVVAVAHRLSTLREMDRIIVMENGHIIEDGTHESLKKAGGVYQRLWEHQAGGFLQE